MSLMLRKVWERVASLTALPLLSGVGEWGGVERCVCGGRGNCGLCQGWSQWRGRKVFSATCQGHSALKETNLSVLVLDLVSSLVLSCGFKCMRLQMHPQQNNRAGSKALYPLHEITATLSSPLSSSKCLFCANPVLKDMKTCLCNFIISPSLRSSFILIFQKRKKYSQNPYHQTTPYVTYEVSCITFG